MILLSSSHFFALIILCLNFYFFFIYQFVDCCFLSFLSVWRSILLSQQTILKIFILGIFLSILVRCVTLLKVTNINV
ncbi:hypothetical protein E4Y41_14510 [Salmonella enterica]|nr:hypothetical protein [Salmonella enterica]EAQ4826087.1 hypothetical protein [Salmonella enterica]EAR9525278.1 hypothetical protein [Salmonella enterica]EAS0126381.1 hypothetical protein [Salmonella enterica]EAS1289249.1 hypothetical protein [Salmonella enterica]